MRYEELDVNKVELDVENPRIKQYLTIYKTLTSETVRMALSGSSEQNASGKYTALRDSIKENKGIFTPIIVNHITKSDRYIAIEGNTRLKFYQEFLEKEPDGPWKTIISIVYDDMSDDQIHAIRLQAHMVGARDWDAFSKAKYLDYLYNDEKKSMDYLKVFCGGQESYIRSLINAYHDMMSFYVPEQEKQEIQFDPEVFSYYVEAQKNSCKEALAVHGYDMGDFTKWVISEKIERAEHVRKIAKILGEEDARRSFLRTNSTEAIKKLDSKEIDQKKIEKTDLYKIVHEITIRIRNIKHDEFNSLKYDPKYSDKVVELEDLEFELSSLIKELKEE